MHRDASYDPIFAIREHPHRAIPFKGSRSAARERAWWPATCSWSSGPMAKFAWVQTLLLSRLIRWNDRPAIWRVLPHYRRPTPPILPSPPPTLYSLSRLSCRDPFRSPLPSSCHLSRQASPYPARLPRGRDTTTVFMRERGRARVDNDSETTYLTYNLDSEFLNSRLPRIERSFADIKRDGKQNKIFYLIVWDIDATDVDNN